MAWTVPGSTLQRNMLLELPAELRGRIFEFALVSDKPLVTFHIDEYQQEDYQEAVQPPLLTVSRQIRQEALPLFYGCNDFIFFTEGRKADEAHNWLDRVRLYLDCLGGITFWLRYVNSVPSHVSPSGAIAITMRYAPRKERWIVCPDWKWISPVRKHDDTPHDAEYLTDRLQCLIDEKAEKKTVEIFINLMNTLRKSYIDHKVH